MKVIWDWLITPPPTADLLNPLSGAYLVVFLAGFIITAYRERSHDCPVAETDPGEDRKPPCARIGLWIFGIGLVFLAVRTLQIDPLRLGAPVWMIAAVIALVVAGCRCFDVRRLN
jgi:hypothetical protein